MGASVNDIANRIMMNERNKNRKRIFIFSKYKPDRKIKRILLVGSSRTKISEKFNNEYELENVLDIYLAPRAVVTTTQLQSIQKSDTNKINTDDRRALSQSSVQVCTNSCNRNRYLSHNNVHFKTQCKVYRCQISTNQEACCCSCNSDAMFEVMKSLYDCYKKKNCDNCNCILCGRWPREKRGSPASHEIETASKKKILEKNKLSQENIEKKESIILPKKEKAELELKYLPETQDQIVKASTLKETAVSTERLKEKSPDLLKILETTPQDQKEKIIRDAVLKGAPIPEAKTATDKKIIDKIQKDVGLPPKPKSSSEKAKYEKALNKGLITPLQGKTVLQKEKILQGQANLGLKLPEGRTSSEKALIAKVQNQAKTTKKIKLLEKETAKSIKESKGPSDECLCSLMTPKVDLSAKKVESAHKTIKDKEPGRVSVLQGKTKSQKEKILKGIALQGLPLPEEKTPSEKDLLDNVRANLGLPPTPKTPALRQKYKEATTAGIITPLEGKTAKQKEKILREQAALGIPLPEGRTVSEKSIVAKIKAIAPPLSDISVSSKILKKAKDTGLLTPLKGKPREEKEKILTGLAMHGVPLPEARTASERKIVTKIHADLGLPPPPTSSSAKAKYQKAYIDGLIVPLEGKSVTQKEKILKNQANVGLDLPVGRTPSEKVLIEKVKDDVKKFEPVQKLKGKPIKEKEKILKGLAMNGILLPEAKSPSEKKLIDKVRVDLGLPPEPTSDSERRAYNQSIATGDIAPLEGKSQIQKEKILRNVAKMGLKLPTGRTPSEKALVTKVLVADTTMPLRKFPSVEMERKSKRSILMARLDGKPPDHKEKILKELAIRGIPLPKARTASEQKLIDKVRRDVTYPPPKDTGVPEGQQVTLDISEVRLPSQVVRKAKAAGLLTPLRGKKKEHKENILKGLALNGIPLPQANTSSEQKIINKVQKQLGLPPAPKTPSEKKLYTKAIISGKIAPLEGKTALQKEEIVKNQLKMGLDVPIGRTPSERVIIDKAIQSEIQIPSHILRRAKNDGLLTPLKGKNKKEKELILKGLAMNGIPLPEANTSSENKIIEKVREDLGLPPEPATPSEKAKYKKAIISGRIAPLEGKTNSEKEEILKNVMKTGMKLPRGRTSSEKSLINKAKKSAPSKKPSTVSSEKLKKAIDSSMVVPLDGKSKEEKEKILTDLALRNIPLPKAKTASDRKIIKKVQADVGLPPQPKTSFERQQYENALVLGYITPLEGKTANQKEKLLRNQAAMGLTLPKGRTTSEKALVAKIKTSAPKVPKSREKVEQLQKKSAKLIKEAKGPSDECICGIISTPAPLEKPPKEIKGEFEIRLPSQVFKKAKQAGLLTPLEGKNKEQKENIFKGLAMNNIPLPDGKSPSENKIIHKVRTDLGLPSPPGSHSEREKYNKAIISGKIAPLEGKSSSEKEDIIKNQLNMGLNVPNGRTPSEKALIDKLKKTTPLVSRSKSLMVPLEGKTKEEKENILKDLALRGLPLPDAKTASDKKIVRKIVSDVGLPPPPKTSFEKKLYKKAFAQGYIVPLEGKTAEEKNQLLRNQAAIGLTLPKGRTSSEKALIAKVKKTVPKMPKSQEQLDKLKKTSAKGMREPKGPSDECICSVILSSEISTDKITSKLDKDQTDVPPEVLKKAKEAGLLTPLKGKKKEQKEAILRGLAMKNIPLPEATSPSDHKLIKKVHEDLGLPPAPKSLLEKQKYKKAIISGKIAPLEGKSITQKEDILRNQMEMGFDLPKGRTSSERSLIDKVKKDPKAALPSQILKKAKAAGLLTPLEGKKKEQKEKILRGLAMNNIPLPEAKTISDNEIIVKVQKDLAIPPAPKSPADKYKYNKAIITGQIAPLEGKTRSQKEDIIKNQIKMGLTLPKGRTSSEKSLIEKITKLPETSLLRTRIPSEKTTGKVSVPSEVMRKAKDAGLLTPLKGKKKKQKEAILKGLALNNIPLPEAKTSSENKIIEKVREDLGLPPVPISVVEKDKYNKAIITGHIAPLEGKTATEKEEILKNQFNMGLSLPKGRTSSEKSLIAKIKKLPEIAPPTHLSKSSLSEKSIIDRATSEVRIPSKIMKKAKEAGLLTPLRGKKKRQKEAILKGLAMNGIPLPEAKTSSEKKLLDKIRLDIGLPPEPVSPEEKAKYKKAIISGKIRPLEGQTPIQKEDIVRNQLKMGFVLPKGRTTSEKNLIDKVKVESEVRLPSKQLRKAKAAGLLTPLEGKSKEQKESIMKGLAMNNIPLPEAKSPSENKLLEKVREQIGLPPAPALPLEKDKYNKAIISGHIAPLEGKTTAQKENIIRNQLKLGLNLAKGRTTSERMLIDKVKKSSPKVSKTAIPPIKSLEGKIKEEKEKIMKDLAMREIPLPDARTVSDKKIIEKVQDDIGLPPQPKTSLEKIQYEKAATKGLIIPLEGKSSEQKENILRKQAKMGIKLPKGRTSSEKALITRIKNETSKERGKIEKVSAKKIRESKGPVDDCICDDDVLKPSSILSQQIKEAKAAGYFQPLEGKQNHEKERILKNLAMQGIVLPKAKNRSEKKIIDKVRYDLGLPSEPMNEKEKQRYDKALTKGYLVPLEGKSKSQKEKILRNQAALGINLPKGRTPSENSLIEKVKTATKKASKISILSESTKSMSAKHGISESIQEVTKTTTCDKECGCDLKKVKFKHSYVKIKITSPDMSSICPCPEECFPGVKGGVFTDNEGIKITVGRVSEMSGFLQNNQIKNENKCSFTTLTTFYKEEKVKRKITRSETYLTKFRENEYKLNTFVPQIVSNASRKIIKTEDSGNTILRNYSSTTSSSLRSRFFEIDSSLSFVTPNSVSNNSLDVLHQCDRYFRDYKEDENKSGSELNIEKSSFNSLVRLSDVYKKSSAIFFNSEVFVENLSQYLCPLKLTRSDFQDYECTARGSFGNVKEENLEDVLKQIIAKELISKSSSFIVIVQTSSEKISDCYSGINMRSSICIQVSKNCCYRDKPKNKGCAPIKKIEFKLSNHDTSLRACSFMPGRHSPSRISEQTATQENRRSRVISTDTTQDRPCCCHHNNTPGRSKDYTTPSKLCVNKSTASDMTCSELIDVLKNTMSVACGPSENIATTSKPAKQKCQPAIHCKPKIKQQRTDRPCGCCSSSIELSHYEICVDVDPKKKSPRPTSKNSRTICQCPDDSVAMDCEKYLKQVQSDMTRRTSGFKVTVEPQTSFEDVLEYYARQIQSDCDCSKRSKKDCECPAAVEPFNGLKLHVEGKGSSAKRFLCFDLLNYSTPYQKFRIDSNSMLLKIDDEP